LSRLTQLIGSKEKAYFLLTYLDDIFTNPARERFPYFWIFKIITEIGYFSNDCFPLL